MHNKGSMIIRCYHIPCRLFIVRKLHFDIRVVVVGSDCIDMYDESAMIAIQGRQYVMHVRMNLCVVVYRWWLRGPSSQLV